MTFERADEALSSTLDSLDGADRYSDWVFETIAPSITGEIIEVGAGHGAMIERLRSIGLVTALEPSPRAASLLRDRFGADDRVTVHEGFLDSLPDDRSFDSGVLVNVLEHIDDDVSALSALRTRVRPGGTVTVFVPAHEALYSTFDLEIGHRRRYRRSTLAQALALAGYEVVELRYTNALGALAWLLAARVSRRRASNKRLARIYDQLVVPVAKALERNWRPPFGQSLVAVARRPLDPR